MVECEQVVAMSRKGSSMLRRRLPAVVSWRLHLVISIVTVAIAVGSAALVLAWAQRGDVVEASLLAGLSCALVVPWVTGWMLRWLARATHAADELALRATHDELTGVHNRRHFVALAERELARCRRYQTLGALLMIDADHFRAVNERHGRDGGDALLREITRAAQDSLRQADLIARFGGEELIVFLPHTDPLGALDVADRIREKVAEMKLDRHDSELRTTVSIGVAALESGHASLDALIHDASSALYAAKQAGRNCVRAAPIPPRRSAAALRS
jgi:diguanylate cyclase (GGDEF)-like protein